MNERFLLAVDGGATKTTARLLKGEELLFEHTTTGSNYQAIGVERVTTTLTELLKQIASFTNDLAISCFGIAGIDTELDRQIVQRIVTKSLTNSQLYSQQTIIENDVEAALIGFAQHKNATLLIAGTGAIAYTLTDGQIRRTGGWGHRAGDEGSGYWIGKEILHAIFKAGDGRAQPTLLTKIVLEKLQISSIDELMNWLYASDYRNAHSASLASLLDTAVGQHDQVALAIARHAADELILLASVALDVKTEILFLNGGVLQYNPLIYQYVTDALIKEQPHLTISLCKEQPIDSIVQRAKLVSHINRQ